MQHNQELLSCFPDDVLTLEDRLLALASRRSVPPVPTIRPRPRDIVHKCLRGDIVALEATPDWLDLDEKQRIIRFFVSSTFDDTKHERDVLIRLH